MSDSDRPSPAPSSQDERTQAFAGEVMSALVKADAKFDAFERQVSALNGSVATLSARQSNHTLILAVIALITNLIGPNIWRLGYAPRPASTYSRAPARPISSEVPHAGY